MIVGISSNLSLNGAEIEMQSVKTANKASTLTAVVAVACGVTCLMLVVVSANSEDINTVIIKFIDQSVFLGNTF